MTRVVIDTNVIVSALLNRGGSPAAALALIAERRIIWCVSEAVIAEYREVLNRPKFRHIDRQKIAALLNFAAAGDVATVTTVVSRSPDERDNRFLECAEDAAAHYLITGKQPGFSRALEANRDRHAGSVRSSIQDQVRPP